MKTEEKIRETIKSCRDLAQDYRVEAEELGFGLEGQSKDLQDRALRQELMAYTLEWVLEDTP